MNECITHRRRFWDFLVKERMNGEGVWCWRRLVCTEEEDSEKPAKMVERDKRRGLGLGVLWRESEGVDRERAHHNKQVGGALRRLRMRPQEPVL